MTINFEPNTAYQKFAQKLILQIVENFPQTFYVGGMVRDLLIKKNFSDIDIATQATPSEVMQILDDLGLTYNDSNQNFGVTNLTYDSQLLEITTFRQEYYNGDRFPTISFTNSVEIDSKRRDFTINSLYLQPKSLKVFDPQQGLKDIQNQTIKFIGDPFARVQEDPLRIVRAYVLQASTNFQFEENTYHALVQNSKLVKNISRSRVDKELKKIFDLQKLNLTKKILNLS